MPERGSGIFRYSVYPNQGYAKSAIPTSTGLDMMRKPLLLALVAICCFARADQTPCESDIVLISKNYPTANYASCEAIDNHTFAMAIAPEDEPINPSPWFGFSVNRKDSHPDKEISIRLSYSVAPHRYIPKYSFDKKTWKPIDEKNITHIDESNLELKIPFDNKTTFISAQQIIDQAFYDRWLDDVVEQYPSTVQKVIGYSIAKRPIKALFVNPDADRVVFMLGRQHPPEVSGAVASLVFAESLLKQKIASTDQKVTNALAFFRHHMLVFVPLINPDGVQAGFWRHNLGSKDLNRDWFDGSQPEVRAVLDMVADLESAGKQIVINLDFHSTRRDVMYVQMPDDITTPPAFAERLFAQVEKQGLAVLPEFAPRPLTDQGTSKGYFFKTYGIPSITYEVGDESDTEAVTATAQHFAHALVSLYGQLTPIKNELSVSECETLFCQMVDANSASLLSLNEQKLIQAELAAKIAKEQIRYKAEAKENGWPSGQNYLTLEADYIDRVGVEASNMHIGRSRQDLHGIARRMFVRQNLLRQVDAVNQVRAELINQAREYAGVVIPAYTHGVPSQPATYGHVLLAFEAAFSRDVARLKSAWHRLNVSQLGVAAGSGSGFPLDRERMAYLLGFDGVVENMFDANFLSTADYKLEISTALEQSMATITKFIENVHAQQRNPNPWIYLTEELTSGSSIMPQKRNPRELDKLRRWVAKVLAGATEQRLLNHNVDTGMHDYRDITPLFNMMITSESLYLGLANLVANTHVDRERAIHEINRGYSTTTEIADTLFREAGVSFRNAHAFAKVLTDLVRKDARPLGSLTDREITSTYRGLTGEDLPLSIEKIRNAMSPTGFVEIRQQQGGPSREQTLKAVLNREAVLHKDSAWLLGIREHLRERSFNLSQKVHELAGGSKTAGG